MITLLINMISDWGWVTQLKPGYPEFASQDAPRYLVVSCSELLDSLSKNNNKACLWTCDSDVEVFKKQTAVTLIGKTTKAIYSLFSGII